MVVAWSHVPGVHQEGEQSLEELVATWLGVDPEHGPALRLRVIDPGKELAGLWSAETRSG